MILPVVGLLLLLGLFWFWASSLIGDDGDAPATPSTQAIILTPEPPTPTATTEADIAPVETTETDGGDNGDGNGDPAPSPTPTEEEDESTDGAYEIDDLVAVTESVNLRSAPTNTEENVITTLSVNTELRIIGGPREANGFTWWEVSIDDEDIEGWVVENYIEPS